MHALRLTMIAATVAIAASCGGGSNSTGGGGYGGGGGACSGTNANVAVCDNFFSPNNITVANGGTVMFTFKGHVGHNVTFLSGPTSPPNSATMSSGTFTTAALSTGTYTFECNIHLFTGTITVSP